ncbi:MAG: prepilin-type N-terminal cleavage/methylation domain-containing protein [Cyanobacteria bacterium P01_C01_bin.89]
MRLGLFSNTDRLNGTNQRSLLQRFHGTLRWYLAHLIKGRSQKSTAGFTLAELLITLIISSIIIVGLLTLVVDLVSSNRKELARTETQREMSIASEYMSSELREAAYVYTGDCLWQGGTPSPDIQPCQGLFNGGGNLRVPDDSVPVIAFWKLDPLPANCNIAECANYAVAQRSYTLVVYFLSQADPDNRWDGQARLTRAELSRFTATGELGDLGGSPDPNSTDVTFRQWASATSITPDDAVLVDYVDATPDQQDLQEGQECPERYEITPSKEALNAEGFDKVRSVYACVRDDAVAGSATNVTTSFNQKVVLFVRGNPQGRYGLDAQACGNTLEGTLRTERQDLLTGTQGICNLPTVKTEVLNRGVANKVPSQLGGSLPTTTAGDP